MEAFEKWQAEVLSEEDLKEVQSHSKDRIDKRLKYISESAWRAALKWLLTQHPCGYMRDIMEKELEDK